MFSKSGLARIFTRVLAVICFASPQIVGAEVPSLITGECVYDSSLAQTICNYTVFSGRPALSYFIFPICANCADQFTVSSPFFTFQEPQTYNDQFCGEIFGIKADQELAEEKVTTFSIVYNGLCSTGVSIVYAALKWEANCVFFPVPGVIDCPPVPSVRWSLQAREFEFQIKKPGAYAACLTTMTIESNMQVNVKFESFGDLIATECASAGSILMHYATAPVGEQRPPSDFLTPEEFNKHALVVPQDATAFKFSLWARIVVTNETSACEYHNNPVIQLILENSTPLEDGEF